jgi:hypothetical protein
MYSNEKWEIATFLCLSTFLTPPPPKKKKRAREKEMYM